MLYRSGGPRAQMLIEEYIHSKAQITVVTFLHNVFQTNALVCAWHKSRDMSALEHMAQGRVIWLGAKTHDNGSISIVSVHQAKANRHDLQQQVTYTAASHLSSQSNDRRSADAASNNRR